MTPAVASSARRPLVGWQRLRAEPAGSRIRRNGVLFAPDTPARSNCNGSCAGYWPPVTGHPAAGPGVNGRIGTIKRPDGSAQATYNGHPLYTYIGDSAPGQARGNNINLNGGLWRGNRVWLTFSRAMPSP